MICYCLVLVALNRFFRFVLDRLNGNRFVDEKRQLDWLRHGDCNQLSPFKHFWIETKQLVKGLQEEVPSSSPVLVKRLYINLVSDVVVFDEFE